MINADQEDIKGIVQFIVQHVENIKRIILFGSVETKGSGNDFDLALVTSAYENDLKELDMDVGRKIRKMRQKYAIDYFVLPVNLINRYKNSIFLNMIDTTGRILYMDKESINEWIDDAKLYYDQSVCLFQGEYYKGACYHAHQCSEKLLKAKLFQYEWELKKVHSIETLMSELKSYGYSISDITDDELTFIDSVYRCRYPGENGLLPYGPPSKDDARKSISIAFRIGSAMGLALKKVEEKHGC